MEFNSATTFILVLFHLHFLYIPMWPKTWARLYWKYSTDLYLLKTFCPDLWWIYFFLLSLPRISMVRRFVILLTAIGFCIQPIMWLRANAVPLWLQFNITRRMGFNIYEDLINRQHRKWMKIRPKKKRNLEKSIKNRDTAIKYGSIRLAETGVV